MSVPRRDAARGSSSAASRSRFVWQDVRRARREPGVYAVDLRRDGTIRLVLERGTSDDKEETSGAKQLNSRQRRQRARKDEFHRKKREAAEGQQTTEAKARPPKPPPPPPKPPPPPPPPPPSSGSHTAPTTPASKTTAADGDDVKGKRGKREAARADIGSPSTSVTDAQQSTTIVEHTDAKDVIVSARGLSNKAKKKLKFKATLDPAAVQTTWAEMQSNEQRSDPQGFASIWHEWHDAGQRGAPRVSPRRGARHLLPCAVIAAALSWRMWRRALRRGAPLLRHGYSARSRHVQAGFGLRAFRVSQRAAALFWRLHAARPREEMSMACSACVCVHARPRPQRSIRCPL
jgi:hypothetical protein